MLLAQKQDDGPAVRRPLSLSLPQGIAEEPWRCAMCQYLNRAAETQCVMCNAARAEGEGESHEEAAEEKVKEVVTRASRLGAGMKLKKTVEVCVEE